MSVLVSFGELLVDMLAMPDGDFRPFPGGAPANVAVGYARLGGKSYFAGGLAEDVFAGRLKAALASYNVDTGYLKTVGGTQTALALVQLDKDHERSFSFYRQGTADIAVTLDHFSDIDWQRADIFHFCSNTLVNDSIAEVTHRLSRRARTQGLITSFDVNLRPLLWPDERRLSQAVERCLDFVDILKLSVEELTLLSGQMGRTPEAYIASMLQLGIKVILLSDGPRPTRLITADFELSFDAPIVEAVDTTAAGDAMVAGFLFELGRLAEAHKACLLDLLSERPALTQATAFALRCGALACTRLGAFTSLPSLDEVENV